MEGHGPNAVLGRISGVDAVRSMERTQKVRRSTQVVNGLLFESSNRSLRRVPSLEKAVVTARIPVAKATKRSKARILFCNFLSRKRKTTNKKLSLVISAPMDFKHVNSSSHTMAELPASLPKSTAEMFDVSQALFSHPPYVSNYRSIAEPKEESPVYLDTVLVSASTSHASCPLDQNFHPESKYLEAPLSAGGEPEDNAERNKFEDTISDLKSQITILRKKCTVTDHAAVSQAEVFEGFKSSANNEVSQLRRALQESQEDCSNLREMIILAQSQPHRPQVLPVARGNDSELELRYRDQSLYVAELSAMIISAHIKRDRAVALRCKEHELIERAYEIEREQMHSTIMALKSIIAQVSSNLQSSSIELPASSAVDTRDNLSYELQGGESKLFELSGEQIVELQGADDLKSNKYNQVMLPKKAVELEACQQKRPSLATGIVHMLPYLARTLSLSEAIFGRDLGDEINSSTTASAVSTFMDFSSSISTSSSAVSPEAPDSEMGHTRELWRLNNEERTYRTRINTHESGQQERLEELLPELNTFEWSSVVDLDLDMVGI